MRIFLAALMALAVSAPAFAQDLYSGEVIVTGSRISSEQEEYDDYDAQRAAVGLRRTADFLVQEVIIRGDTREPEQRRREIQTMLNQAVKMAEQQGVELAYGSYILTPLNTANVKEIPLQRDSRPDSERVTVLVKAKLSGSESGRAAQERIAAYIKSVPETGRAEMDEFGDATLSVVGPDSYRHQITAAIAKDAKLLTNQMGENYAVEVEGLNRPVQWARSGPAEVLLYIPYKLTVLPRP